MSPAPESVIAPVRVPIAVINVNALASQTACRFVYPSALALLGDPKQRLHWCGIATAEQPPVCAYGERSLITSSALKKASWRAFGACPYDWTGSKLMRDGVRTTGEACGPQTSHPVANELVAIYCDTLNLNDHFIDKRNFRMLIPPLASQSALAHPAQGGADECREISSSRPPVAGPAPIVRA